MDEGVNLRPILEQLVALPELPPLPVFGHEEEAGIFLGIGGVMGNGWRVRESIAGKLVSVLYRPCAGLKEAALDPSPERMSERTVRLVWLLRKRFISSEPRGSRGRSWHKRAGPQVSPPIDWPRVHLSRFHPLPGRPM
jgi:hypothetical protein